MGNVLRSIDTIDNRQKKNLQKCIFLVQCCQYFYISCKNRHILISFCVSIGLHQKSKQGAFFVALVLMMLTKFVPNRSIRRCTSGIFFCLFDAKFSPNIVKFFLKQCANKVLVIRIKGNNPLKLSIYLSIYCLFIYLSMLQVAYF